MGAARATTLALYRALLGPLRGKEPLRIRLPVKLSKAQWLSGSQSDKTPPSHAQVIRQLFPVVQAEGDGELWGGPEMWGDDPGELSPERARAIVGAKFREPAASSGSVATRLNDAFAALRALNEQAALGQRTAVTRTTPTEGICVCVEASCDSHGKKETTGQTLWLYQYRIRANQPSCESMCSF
uniref:Uncharacterized protein n=1 Tax=Chrysotila carterae TaxID=13221 RepID=A0A7S4B2E7_CHRCT